MLVFDFDKTLTKTDTLLGFYKICSKNKFVFIIKRLYYLLYQILHKMKIITNYNFKNIGVSIFLKGIHKNIINEKCLLYAKKIEFNSIYKKYISDFSNEKNKIVIMSASFEDYIKPIFENTKCLVHGSKLKYDENNFVIGIELNLFGIEKIKLFKKIYKNVVIDRFYTDSRTDFPLASISRKIVLIKNNREITFTNTNDFLNF